MPPFKKLGLHAPVTICYNDTAAAGLQIDGYAFVSDDYYEVIEMREVHDIAGGASAAAVVRKCASGTTIGSGLAIGLTAFDLTAAADTPQRRALSAGTLSATVANRFLSPGDSIGIDYSGTLTAMTGVAITITLRRTRPAANQNR
jgi:hypothetical protein